MWDKVESIISNTQKWRDVRGAFEVVLEKVRMGRTWMEYDKHERLGGRSYASLMRRVRHWDESGEYRRALKVLSSHSSVPAASQFSLPPMRITGVIDSGLGGVSAGQGGDSGNGELGDACARSFFYPTPR